MKRTGRRLSAPMIYCLVRLRVVTLGVPPCPPTWGSCRSVLPLTSSLSRWAFAGGTLEKNLFFALVTHVALLKYSFEWAISGFVLTIADSLNAF